MAIRRLSLCYYVVTTSPQEPARYIVLLSPLIRLLSDAAGARDYRKITLCNSSTCCYHTGRYTHDATVYFFSFLHEFLATFTATNSRYPKELTWLKEIHSKCYRDISSIRTRIHRVHEAYALTLDHDIP